MRGRVLVSKDAAPLSLHLHVDGVGERLRVNISREGNQNRHKGDRLPRCRGVLGSVGHNQVAHVRVWLGSRNPSARRPVIGKETKPRCIPNFVLREPVVS